MTREKKRTGSRDQASMCWTISCSEETSHTPNTSSSKTTDEQMQRPTDSMSWERTAGTSRCDSDQILVFGYSAKLFKDDEQATLVEKGRHLVPCQGQPDLRIDRSVSFDPIRGRCPNPILLLSILSEDDAMHR